MKKFEISCPDHKRPRSLSERLQDKRLKNRATEENKDALSTALRKIGELENIQESSTWMTRQALGRREHEAGTDTLTNLPNRRKIFAHLQSTAKMLMRENKNLSLLFLDIDLFKRINDEYGNDEGDAVLKETANVMATHVSAGDVGRWGGEEFIMVLPDAGEGQALSRAEALRELIEKHSIHLGDKTIHITVSIGLVTCKMTRASEEEITKRMLTLISNASVAMHKAKEEGRNRVVTSNQPI